MRDITFVGVVSAIALAWCLSAGAATTRPGERFVSSGLDAAGQIKIMVNRSAVISTTAPYKRVSIAQPDIADVNLIGPRSLLVTAKKVGSTQLIMWDEQDQAQVIDVTVQIDLQALHDQYRKLFPNARIDVTALQGTIVLRGQIPNLTVAEQAAQLAAPYGKVLNLLEVAGGQQIMLQVRFAEVSRSATSALGINGAIAEGSFSGGSNIGNVNPTSLLPVGRVGDTPRFTGVVVPEQAVSPSVTLYGAGQVGSFFLEYFIESLRQNNLLRILAEPNLVAISGQEASFLAGGEFPIPVSQGGGTTAGGVAISIEYREFGVKLNFVPVVLGNGRVRLKVSPEVSDLDFTTAVRLGGFVVPGLSQRKLTTTVELGDGQSFALAGLLNQTVTATKDVTPVLGDIPIVGALFRSVRYQRKETELLVLVTPRIVEPMNPSQVPLLPGERWRHPSEMELFLNQDIGGPADSRTARPAGRGAPLFYGQYGFTPSTQPAREPAPAAPGPRPMGGSATGRATP